MNERPVSAAKPASADQAYAEKWGFFAGTKDAREALSLRSDTVRHAVILYTQRLTKAGRWLIWPSIFFAGYSFSSLEMQTYVPFCLFSAMWLTALAVAWIVRPRVKLRTWHDERVCAGHALRVDVEVTQQRALKGVDLQVLPHRLPKTVDASPPEGVPLPPLGRGETATVSMKLICRTRGAYNLRGYRVETDYPFGLLRAYRSVESERRVLVYPAFTPLLRMALPVGQRYQPGGVPLASNIGESTEYIGNRDFREGDGVRAIDWRATSRLNKLIVREYREEYFYRVAVILDTHLPKRARKARRQDFEQAVSTAAAVSDYLARQEYIVDLFAAGPNLYHLTAGRSLAYLDQILDILACVDGCPDEPFATIEPELAENLRQISTVIGVFLDWDETRRRLMLQLRAQGVGIKPIVVRDGPCTEDPAAELNVLGHIPVLSPADFKAGVTEL